MNHQFSEKRNKEVEKSHLKMAVFNEPAILVNLGSLYQPNIDPRSMYEITKSLLKVNGKRAKKIRLVCAAYHGFIKEVYIVSGWSKPHFWSSYSFDGEPAPLELREKYVGRSVASYWEWGSQAPIKFASYVIKGKERKS
ncbi:MAG TPA: hypothetical protein P5080_00170 [Candidatus Paceibacterota bacterium]|nr:hypothetical protein [Candidatus Pacearchaeota archaeon]HRZ50389.1 hypothetical protein [Candidatus Paceibacterota bacterium]HSA36110.1 hypothetical protein [Candidatus Paceibacterota bacterium]